MQSAQVQEPSDSQPSCNPDPMRIFPLTAKGVEQAWGELRPRIERCLEWSFGRMTVGDVIQGIRQEMVKPFVIVDTETNELMALILAEREEYPQKSVLCLSACSGDQIERWGHLFPAFEALAWQMNCDQLEITGRPGWARFLKLKPQIQTLIVENPNGR